VFNCFVGIIALVRFICLMSKLKKDEEEGLTRVF